MERPELEAHKDHESISRNEMKQGLFSNSLMPVLFGSYSAKIQVH